ncbi:hypothetical protein CEP54_004652 [Fusarium duplospermum]|uniref:Uncharacterized protein n=1 Tax=Fusarium duplospermum TaxID=1325734 RepID=A0A428QGU1_9HYPO|nr:hypothetical protein CEP54_004652 [Fusarium duplospermum]
MADLLASVTGRLEELFKDGWAGFAFPFFIITTLYATAYFRGRRDARRLYRKPAGIKFMVIRDREPMIPAVPLDEFVRPLDITSTL